MSSVSECISVQESPCWYEVNVMACWHYGSSIDTMQLKMTFKSIILAQDASNRCVFWEHTVRTKNHVFELCSQSRGMLLHVLLNEEVYEERKFFYYLNMNSMHMLHTTLLVNLQNSIKYNIALLCKDKNMRNFRNVKMLSSQQDSFLFLLLISIHVTAFLLYPSLFPSRNTSRLLLN